jgi:hypothetical protein
VVFDQNRVGVVVSIVLSIGGMFDWITPIISLYMRSIGKWVGFRCTLRKYTQMHPVIKSKGLSVYCVQVCGDKVVFDVRKDQYGLFKVLMG